MTLSSIKENNAGTTLLKTLLFLFAFITIPILTNAQSISVTGQIKDAQTKENLVGATILVLGEEAQKGTSTDETGRFDLQVSELPVTVTISYVGYKNTAKTLSRQSENTIFLLSENLVSEDVIVKATRVGESTPMSYSEVDREFIESENLGQDIPYLISQTPSLVSTSDAGAGIGYTGVRIRGVDPARINVTVNGVPINDAESHGVFWVNMPDLASSVQSIQVQRGVGTSTNGPAAFGASINIETTTLNPEPYGDVSLGLGSYNTQKSTVKFGTGLLSNGWSFDGRLSNIKTDGYIDRASSNLESYFFNAAWHGDNHLLKAVVFSGEEKTYQAWYGTPEAVIDGDEAAIRDYIARNGLDAEDAENILNSGRTYNFYTYDNETDNYGQDHYQLHYSYVFGEDDASSVNLSTHYTHGEGYYETYRKDDDLADYNIGPVYAGNDTINTSDLIRQKWLDNDFYGMTGSLQSQINEDFALTAGFAANNYEGRHFGEVIWARFAGDSENGDNYYDNDGEKLDLSGYVKAEYELLDDKMLLYGDMQLRYLDYQFLGFDRDNFNNLQEINLSDQLTFFNPKAGLTYRFSDRQKAFASFSVGNKEPTREEYVNSVRGDFPEPETLYNLETGYEYQSQDWMAAVNGYWMNYHNQLILTGEINDVGAYIRENVEDSYRLGIETQAGVRITDWLEWSGNLTLSQNKIDEYNQYYDNYDLAYVNGLPQQDTVSYSNTEIAFSPSVIGQSIVTLVWENFELDWITKYVSRQYLDNTGQNSRSLDPYLVNDITFRAGWNPGKFVNDISLALKINNLFSELYEANGYTYSYVWGGELTTENFYYPQAERNFLMQLKVGF
jgi:iron complex outermembrane receptor protein